MIMLLSLEQLAVLVPLMVMAAATPGPDVLYIIGHATGPQRRQGIVAATGIATGLLGHTLAAAVGLSSLFLHVPLAYTLLKGIGAAYLLWLAWKLVQSARHTGNAAETSATAPSVARLWSIYGQGVLTNLLNPKAALFFLGVLPQFADPARGNVPAQLMAISLVATGTAFTTHLTLALVARAGLARLRSRTRAWRQWPRYGLALLFGGLAIRLALSERPH